MLQRWTAETHMRRWNFNAADPDSNLLLNRDVSRWNRDVSPFQLQSCDCGKTLQKFKHKSTKNMSEPRQKMPSSTLPKKIHRTEIRKYPPANPPKNLENNPPKTKFLISDYIQKTIRTFEEFPPFLRKTLPSFAEIAQSHCCSCAARGARPVGHRRTWSWKWAPQVTGLTNKKWWLNQNKIGFIRIYTDN